MSQTDPQSPEPSYRSYKDLRVWQKSVELAQSIYLEIEGAPANYRQGIGQLLLPLIIEIPSLIANGYAARAKTDYIHGLKQALGKVNELEIALNLQKSGDHHLKVNEESLLGLRKMLASLTASLTKPKIKEGQASEGEGVYAQG